MSMAHQRKKDPEKVRLKLIESARKLAMENGLAGVNVEAVAAEAGVSRGSWCITSLISRCWLTLFSGTCCSSLSLSLRTTCLMTQSHMVGSPVPISDRCLIQRRIHSGDHYGLPQQRILNSD